MKIAIMTWFQYNNYGTVLQAAALVHVLKSLGHEAEIIDYYPGERVLSLPVERVRYELMRKVKEKRQQERDPVIVTQISGSQFDAFRNAMLPMTRYCETLSDLESLNDGYDAFICGSDRIWLPENFDPHYYLDFVHDPRRMIAYAPSILDTGKADKHVLQKMEQLISRFTHLSVREEEGRKYLDRCFGEKTLELADPVLLLQPDEWENALQLPGDVEEHYLLVLFQGGGHFFYYEAAQKLASRLSLEVRLVPVHASDLRREGVYEAGAGPYELLSLIRNADYVCTDSYHTMLLAILFHREFCCFEQFTERSKLAYNSRVWHILKALGLDERLYDNNAPLERYLEKIDYIPVEYKLDALKLKSASFLQESLKDVEECAGGETKSSLHVREGYRLCSGCGACTAVCGEGAVSIQYTSSGFFEAVVDETRCIRCGMCLQACPFREETGGNRLAEGKLLSYCDEVPEMSENASGGGLAGRLSRVLHAEGYTIAGCVFDESMQMARHILVGPDQDPKELAAMQGSKYLQSNLSSFWREVASVGGPIAFFGTPCQIAGARRVFKTRSDVRYIEIVCGGVPSYLLFGKYKKSFRGRNRMNEETFELSVRYRQVPDDQRYIRVSDGTSERLIPAKKDAYSRMIDSREFLCEACYDCRWRGLSEADLRIGDYRPVSADGSRQRKPNTSSVFCLTPVGKQMLDEMMSAGYWEGLKKKDISEYLSEHDADNPPRPIFYEELTEKFEDDKTSLHKILNEYVKTFEKRKRWERLV